jgi:hypothetical protein
VVLKTVCDLLATMIVSLLMRILPQHGDENHVGSHPRTACEP